MKPFFLFSLIICCSLSVVAQKETGTDEETANGGFRKDYLFSGGNINLSFFNGVTVLGASPQLGYSVAKWLDAGVIFGYTYSSERDVYTNAGGGNRLINKLDANSLLVGAGYTSGRNFRNSPYYYFSVSVDLINNKNSPYTDRFNNLLPVVVAGFNIPLFQGRQDR